MLLSKSRKELITYIINVVILSFCANSFMLMRIAPITILLFVILLAFGNYIPYIKFVEFPGKRLRLCNHGVKCLSAFLISCVASGIYHLGWFLFFRPENWWNFVFSIIVCICVEAIIFWNGIISVYLTSIQLGIKIRVLGVIFGFVPIINLILLFRIITVCDAECDFELEKHRLNESRKDKQICATKYPILLVHGVFFRDIELLNYWGRIPKELAKNGADIYYGEHESAASIAKSAKELEKRIKWIIYDLGCEKVNIIAHSKGGLDCRYAMAHSDVSKYIASLTTINTPHRGCLYADYLLNRISDKVQQKVADTYNNAMLHLGDKNPDFLAAVNNLTSEYCTATFDSMLPPEGVFCQSYGSIQNKARSGKFPMNFTYHVAKPFDGPNDGLVGEYSFAFGEKCEILRTTHKRGITHEDVIDLYRENLPDFDVREFYVQLVADLKNRGL